MKCNTCIGVILYKETYLGLETWRFSWVASVEWWSWYLNICLSSSINCSFPTCAIASPKQKAQKTVFLLTQYLLYTKKRVKCVSVVPGLKSFFSLLDLKNTYMFSSEYMQMEWDWVGCVWVSKWRVFWGKMDYLNGVMPEEVCSQRLSCVIPLFLVERFISRLAIIIWNLV